MGDSNREGKPTEKEEALAAASTSNTLAALAFAASLFAAVTAYRHGALDALPIALASALLVAASVKYWREAMALAKNLPDVDLNGNPIKKASKEAKPAQAEIVEDFSGWELGPKVGSFSGADFHAWVKPAGSEDRFEFEGPAAPGQKSEDDRAVFGGCVYRKAPARS